MQTQMTRNDVRTPVRPEETEARSLRTPQLMRLVPAVDIFENDDEILLMAEMPGACREDLEVHFANDTLTMTCPRKLSDEGVKLVGELRPAEYSRSFLVPKGIDTKMISAELKEGVLRVHLPKSANLKPRHIEVKAG
jgi:HSP20 family molecular chaperone IbpA